MVKTAGTKIGARVAQPEGEGGGLDILQTSDLLVLRVGD